MMTFTLSRLLGYMLICGLAAGTTGCRSMQTVRPNTPAAAGPFGPVKAGDIVRVQTHDGRRITFTVREVSGDALVAEDGERYDRRDIVRLERRAISPGRTALLVVGLGFAAYSALMIAFAIVWLS